MGRGCFAWPCSCAIGAHRGEPARSALRPTTASFKCVPNTVGHSADARSTVAHSVAYSIWARHECGRSTIGLRLDTGVGHGVDRRMGLAWRGALRHQPEPISRRQTRPSIYGNDGGFAAASFSDGAPAVQRLQQLHDAQQLLGDRAPTNGATLFEIRLQCFKSPNCHSDWSYAWTTSFTAAVHDWVASGDRGYRVTPKWSRGARSAEPRHDGDRCRRGRTLQSVYR